MATQVPTTTPPVAVPVTLPRVDLVRQARRRQQTLLAVTRRVAPLLAARARGEELDDRRVARAFRRLTDDLGASYTKFGQFVASASGVFGEDVADEFRSCLDAGPPVPFDLVRRAVERDLGRPLDVVFPEFDPEPLGSASIAVVHRAVTADGRTVAVKVLRPGIRHTVATDLVLMRQLFGVLGRVASPQLGVGLRQGLDNFEAQVREELDLRNEAAAMVHQRELYGALGIDRVVIPDPHLELCGSRVLTMAFLDGVAVHEADELADLAPDPGELLHEAVKAWFVTAVRDGTFHGDVHAGNLMVLRDDRIALLDWGIVGRLPPDALRLFRQLLRGALGDEAALDEVADFFLDHARPVLNRLGFEEAAARVIVRQRARDVLTKPFSEIGFGTFLLTLQQGGFADQLPEGVATATPEAAAQRQRALIRDLLRNPDPEPPPPIDRNLFLLGKQLMFFESYGKRYLSSMAILDDRDFFTELLAGVDD